tara:strand:+ start:3183 stop:3854 length:672 start_codon:yes stop_codon:yes gene_type:complete
MPILCFPSDFVYWESIDKHEEIKLKLLPAITAAKDDNKDNPWSASIVNSGFDTNEKAREKKNAMLNDLFVMEHVVKIPINHLLSQLSELYPFKIEDLFIKDWWWNFYDRGHFQEQHHHSAPPVEKDGKLFYPAVSLIYILHDENISSSVLFNKTAPVPMQATSHDLTFDTGDLKDVKEGTVLVFPSGLRHCVRPCSVPGRVTLSFNVYANLSDNMEWPIRQRI